MSGGAAVCAPTLHTANARSLLEASPLRCVVLTAGTRTPCPRVPMVACFMCVCDARVAWRQIFTRLKKNPSYDMRNLLVGELRSGCHSTCTCHARTRLAHAVARCRTRAPFSPLPGTRSSMLGIVHRANRSLALLFDAIPTLPLPRAARNSITSILQAGKTTSLACVTPRVGVGVIRSRGRLSASG